MIRKTTQRGILLLAAFALFILPLNQGCRFLKTCVPEEAAEKFVQQIAG